MPFSEDHELFPYLLWDVRNIYRRSEGNLLLPVAYQTGGGSKDTAKVVSTSKSWGTRELFFTIIRLGLIPTIPHVEDFDPEVEVLADYEIVPQAPTQLASGTKLYVVSGSYLYSRKVPPSIEEGFRMGKTGIDLSSPQSVGIEKFRTGLR